MIKKKIKLLALKTKWLFKKTLDFQNWLKINVTSKIKILKLIFFFTKKSSYFPFNARTASLASRESSNITKAKPKNN